MSKNKLTGASDAEVIALLKRYKCPTPFHEVRTRFLGSIASPVLGPSPMDRVKQLWGGELPEFDSMEEVNELLAALVAGLWNRLTAHQSGRNTFRLTRFETEQTRDGLKHLTLVRRQELDGFVEGPFGPEEHITKHCVINNAACFGYCPSQSGRLCCNTYDAMFRSDLAVC